MKLKVLKENVRKIIRQELAENQPNPSKPAPVTVPKEPKTKPDEKRRRIGKPGVQPKPKALKEDEIVNKIVSRFTSKNNLNEWGGPVPKADINIEYVGAPDNISPEKIQKCVEEIKANTLKTLKETFGVPANFVNVKFNGK